jgi:hypothetical protein
MGNANLKADELATPVTVANGGTGASTLTGVLTGNGTSAVTASAVTEGGVLLGDASNGVTDTGVLAKGTLLIGDGAGAPTELAVGSNDQVLTADSAEASGVKWADAGGGDNNAPVMPGLGCSFQNLSFTLSTGTITVAGADGTALGAGNPGYITLPSNATPGQLVQLTLTSNLTLDENDLDGNIGNMTASTAYSNSFPLYLGIMADASDANPVLVVTWLPHILVSPSSGANIGDPSAANADVQYSVFSASDITEADYTSKSIGLIGSVTATKNASDEYTIDTLSAAYDGIGRFQEERLFEHGVGLFGAGSGSPIKANGGTAPVFNVNNIFYSISRDGRIRYDVVCEGDGGTDGSGAVASYFALAFACRTDASKVTIGPGWGQAGALGSNIFSVVSFTATDPAGAAFIYDGSDNYENAEFTNTGRRVAFTSNYLADNGR